MAVKGSRIAAVGPTAELTTRFQAAETIDASDAQIGVRVRFTPRINAMPSGGMTGWKVSGFYPLDPDAGQTAYRCRCCLCP